MNDQIAKLMQRYGSRHNFLALSQQQIAFLLHPEIRDNTDRCGWNTVSVRSITTDIGAIRLDILDVFHYLFHRNSPGGRGDYAISRNQRLKTALNIAEYPTNLEGCVYVFCLPDNTLVNVEYFCIKDRV